MEESYKLLIYSHVRVSNSLEGIVLAAYHGRMATEHEAFRSKERLAHGKHIDLECEVQPRMCEVQFRVIMGWVHHVSSIFSQEIEITIGVQCDLDSTGYDKTWIVHKKRTRHQRENC